MLHWTIKPKLYIGRCTNYFILDVIVVKKAKWLNPELTRVRSCIAAFASLLVFKTRPQHRLLVFKT
jgi:hypothetical protein